MQVQYLSAATAFTLKLGFARQYSKINFSTFRGPPGNSQRASTAALAFTSVYVHESTVRCSIIPRPEQEKKPTSTRSPS